MSLAWFWHLSRGLPPSAQSCRKGCACCSPDWPPPCPSRHLDPENRPYTLFTEAHVDHTDHNDVTIANVDHTWTFLHFITIIWLSGLLSKSKQVLRLHIQMGTTTWKLLFFFWTFFILFLSLNHRCETFSPIICLFNFYFVTFSVNEHFNVQLNSHLCFHDLHARVMISGLPGNFCSRILLSSCKAT